jgi:predicted DNA-binding protein (UPF0278 family)
MNIRKSHIKGRQDIPKVKLTIYIEEGVNKEFELFCKRKNISKNMFVNEAMREYSKTGHKFDIRKDRALASTKIDYISQAVEWWLNEQED